jgi:hypothetical protein
MQTGLTNWAWIVDVLHESGKQFFLFVILLKRIANGWDVFINGNISTPTRDLFIYFRS